MAREMYGEDMSAEEAKGSLAHYGQLKGWTVVGVDLHQDAHNKREFWPILTFRKGQETRTVQVSRDTEGDNGSGHLFIMNSDGYEIVVGMDTFNSTKAEVYMTDEKDTNKMNLVNLEDINHGS